jgi:tetrathionate reductase subunit B
MTISRRDALHLMLGNGFILAGASKVLVSAAQPGSQPRWGLLIDLRKCVGCQACMVACGLENDTPLGCFRTTVTVSENIEAGKPRRSMIPRTCNHCEFPACVTVCPTGATYQQPDGIVLVDNTVCIGCGYCAQACPYEARFINPASRTADKCTFCVHRLEAGLLPACVETCVGGARVFGDLHDPGSQVSTLLHQHPVQVLKPRSGTQPKVYYIGLPGSAGQKQEVSRG